MNLVAMSNINYEYPNGYKALENISMTIKKGEKIAIVGQNGAGKTTLVKTINGLLRPTDGEIMINNENTNKYTTAEISRKVGYVFQNPDDQIFNNDVYSEIAYGPRSLGINEDVIQKRIETLAELLGLKKFLNENPYNLPFSIRKFVGIASVLSMDVEIIILDEPTAGQDFIGMKLLTDLINLLESNGKTVITITHDMEFIVGNFERVIAMANKKIIADKYKREIFTNLEVMKKAKIKTPYINELANSLNISKNILNIKEFIEYFEQNIKEKDN